MNNPAVPLFDPTAVPPPAWPPARDLAWMEATGEYARRRDPVGDRVHVALACIYLACAGLATSAESAAFVLLVGFTAARSHVLWRSWATLLTSRLLWALLAWTAWNAISLAWSPDRAAGLEMLAGSRGVLVLLAIYPIRDRWRLLVTALMSGLALQALIQFGQAFELLPLDKRNPYRRSGLYSHPGHLCTFYAVAIVLAAAWIRDAVRPRTRLVLLGLIVAYGAGIGIAAGRGAMLALVVALPIVVTVVVLFHGIGPLRGARTLRWAVVALAAIVGIVAISGGGGLWTMARDLAAMSDAGSSAGSRLLYWSASLDTFAGHPIAGIGVGGTRTAFLTHPRILEAAAQHPDLGMVYFAHHHPHSLYVQTLSENGAVGGLLLACFVAATLAAAWSRCREAAIWCGFFAAIVLWFVAAGFEALHVSGRMATLGCVLLAWVACAPGDRLRRRVVPAARDEASAERA